MEEEDNKTEAILLIQTHGIYDNFIDTFESPINIERIIATREGVCNYLDEEM